MVNFKSAFKSVGSTLKAHQIGIMTGGGVFLMFVGAAATIAATVQTMHAASEKKQEMLEEIAATPEEFDDLTDEQKDQYDDICNAPVPVKTLAPVVWKYWMLPILLEILGAVLIGGAQKKSFDKIAGLVAALGYKMAESSDTEEAIKETVGEEKAEEIKNKVIQKQAGRYINEAGEPIAVIETGTGDELFYDYYGARFFKSSMNFLEKKVNFLNYDIACRRVSDAFDNVITSLNDFYNLIPNLDPLGAEFGETLGWDSRSGPIELEQSQLNAFRLNDTTYYYLIKFKGGDYGLHYLNPSV